MEELPELAMKETDSIVLSQINIISDSSDKNVSKEIGKSNQLNFQTKPSDENQPRNQNPPNLFKNYLKQEKKRFSRQILTNSLLVKKEVYIKQLMGMCRNQSKSPEQLQTINRIICQNNLFPEFNNDMKILRILGNSIEVCWYPRNEIIFYKDQWNSYVHKVLDGEVLVKSKMGKNQKNKQKRDSQYVLSNNSKYSVVVKEKGEFLQNMNDFKCMRQYEATSSTQSYIIRIQHELYQKVTNIQIQTRATTKLVSNSQLFYNFSYKQIERLLERVKNLALIKNMVLFHENQNISGEENKKMYFIVQGDLMISKKINNREKVICTLNDGNIVGDEVIFCNDLKTKRQYTVIVKSLTAQVLQIEYKIYCDWLKLNGTSIDKNIEGKQLAQWRLSHYNTANGIRTTPKTVPMFRNPAISHLAQEKKSRLLDIVSIAGNIEKKVESLQTIKRKRLDFNVTEIEVNFQHPLFRRGDLPGLGGFLKRFVAEERRMEQLKERISKLSTINLR